MRPREDSQSIQGYYPGEVQKRKSEFKMAVVEVKPCYFKTQS